MAYFPNHSHAESILLKQCDNCKLFDKCPIFDVQYAYNYDAVENELASDILNHLIDNKEGCQLFKAYEEILREDT